MCAGTKCSGLYHNSVDRHEMRREARIQGSNLKLYYGDNRASARKGILWDTQEGKLCGRGKNKRAGC